MALVRWGRQNDLFSELNKMQSDMDRLFSAFAPWQGWSRPSTAQSQVYPPLNIYNDNESFILRAEVPGVDPNTLDIEVTGDTLTLRGERKLPELPEGASYHRRERDFGHFRRSFTLPEKVDTAKVVARCEHGVLEVRLPHAEEAKARKIAVNNK